MEKSRLRVVLRHRTINSLLAVMLVSVMFITTGLVSGCEQKPLTFNDVDLQRLFKFDDITYRMVDMFHLPDYSEEDFIEYDTVRSFVPEAMHNPRYRLKNGDSTLLETGTKVYEIKGYSPHFRLYADPFIYEAETNPHARKGADLLDIAGKVEYIDVGSARSATYRDPDTVSALVEIVLEAPVDQSVRWPQGKPITLYFHLRDNTEVVRKFCPESGLMWKGIKLPGEFRTMCSPDSTPVTTDPAGLRGTQWTLTSIDGNNLIQDTYISLYLHNDGSIWGYSGLNTFSGNYSLESPDAIDIFAGNDSEIGSTEEIILQENSYIQGLNDAISYHIDGETLRLLNIKDEELHRFQQKPEYLMDPNDLITTSWRLINMNGNNIPQGLSVTLIIESDSTAFGRAGCFDYGFYYWGSGDDIINMGGWGRRNGDLPDELERLAGAASSAISSCANYRLAQGMLEIYSARGDTLVFKPY